MPKGSFLIFCLIFIGLAFSLSATAALIPTLANYFAVEKSLAVRLTWLYMLPYSIAAFLWGPLSRVVTVKKLLLIVSLGFCLCTLFFGLSNSITQAFVFRFLMGCFGSGFVPLTFITIGKAVNKENKAKYLGIFFALSTSSACVGVFLSGFVLWRAIYLVPAVISSLIFILILLYLEDFDFRREKFKLSYLETFKDRAALRLFAAIGLGSFLFHGLQQNLGVYLSERFYLSQMAISLIFTLSTLSAIAIRFLGGFLSSTFGNIKITRIGFILMSIFSAILFISPSFKPIILTIILWGVGWALAHVGLSAYLAHMPDKVLRDASSLNSSLRLGFGGLGAFFGSILASSIVGFKVLFFLMVLSLFFLGFWVKSLLDQKKECYG